LNGLVLFRLDFFNVIIGHNDIFIFVIFISFNNVLARNFCTAMPADFFVADALVVCFMKLAKSG
jgi:hypothetical protein